VLLVLVLGGGSGFALWKIVDIGREAGFDEPALVVGPAVSPLAPAPLAPKEPALAISAKSVEIKTTETFADEAPIPKKASPAKIQLERRPRPDATAAKGERVIEMKRPRPRADAGGVDEDKVSQAIDKGLAYLRTHPWTDESFNVGFHALGGLTLLECGVPVDDPRLQDAASVVRTRLETITFIYELALAILLLDRIGDPADHRRIQGLSLRLLAAQAANGGWTYVAPTLSADQMASLFHFLYSHRPPHLQRARQPVDKKGRPVPERSANVFDQFGAKIASAGIEARPGAAKRKSLRPALPEALPPELRELPIVVQLVKGRGKYDGTGIEDNSNTQFALMGLWIARRHDVPVDEAFLSALRRFQNSQFEDGQWEYSLGGKSGPAMTAVGLLGLAMGQVIAAEQKEAVREPAKANLRDEGIQKGLRYLGQKIEAPLTTPDKLPPMQDLYFMWSVERVAVLYDLKTLGGKDWYGWGAQILLAHQDADGSWKEGHFNYALPHVNTCFALLFLKRSNLVQDLTENLRLFMPIRDQGR
jgi:hypothetical protein